MPIVSCPVNAQAVLLPGTPATGTGTPLHSPPALWQWSMPKQLPLCIILIIIYKNIFLEEQDCPQATAVAVDLVLCHAKAGCLQSQKKPWKLEMSSPHPVSCSVTVQRVCQAARLCPPARLPSLHAGTLLREE